MRGGLRAHIPLKSITDRWMGGEQSGEGDPSLSATARCGVPYAQHGWLRGKEASNSKSRAKKKHLSGNQPRRLGGKSHERISPSDHAG